MGRFDRGAGFVGSIVPIVNSATLSYSGLPALTLSNLTQVAQTIGAAENSLYPRQRWNASATGAGTVMSARIATSYAAVGFYECWLSWRAAVLDKISSARMFMGVTGTVAALTNVNPATLTNLVGFGHDAGGANYKLFYGGTAAQTPIDTGIPIATTEMLTFSLGFTNKGVGWSIYGPVSQMSASGLISPVTSAVIPITSFLSPFNFMRTNNSATGQTQVNFGGLQFEISDRAPT